ncbi:MAG TPA: ABC transporter permease [Gemmatimonadales bacterium]|jgi:ABC-2 type transport system permease protein
MNKVLAVIRREFIARVHTRAFVIGTLIVPLLMFIFGYLPQLLLRRDTRPRTIVLVDATSDGTGEAVAAALRTATLPSGDSGRARYSLVRITAEGEVARLRDSLIRQVGMGNAGGQDLDGVLVVTDTGVDLGRASYFGSNVASFSDMRALERSLGPVLRDKRLRRHGADSALIAAAGVELNLNTSKVTKGQVTGESGESSFWLAYVTSFVMYFSLIMYGIQVMGAVLEEKSNRIVEVLVSSITPFQLLFGKVIGVAGAGLLQLAIWGGASFYVTSILGAGGGGGAEQIAADGSRQSLSLPAVSPDLIAVVLVFFLLGFLLYSALYAAVGAMCNSQQETQQAAQPVTILLAVGFITMFTLINDPSSGLARALSLVPFFAPLVIPVRYAISPLPLSELMAAVAATALGVVAVVWVAARIYRVGILSYGKRPTLKEVWRWVRTA